MKSIVPPVRIRLLVVVSLGIVSLLITNVLAKDIYVAQTAVGNNTGANCANAHSAAWFNTSVNWQTGKTPGKIGPGDAVHLCGTITSNLVARANGSYSSNITILFEPEAKLSQPYMEGGLQINGRSYITVDGGTNGIIECTANGSELTYQHNAQGIWGTNCNNCEIKNLTIRNMYVRTIRTDTSVDSSQVQGVSISGSNTSVHDNIIHDTGIGIAHSFNNGDTNVLIYNNEIYNSNWGISSSCGGNGLGGTFKYYNNHIHDYANWDNPGTNAYHHNGIHFYGSGCQGVQQLWIYNNIFDGNPGVYVTGHVFIEEWTNGTYPIYLYNNVFAASANNAWLMLYRGGTNSVFYNNTFINSGLSIGNAVSPNIKNNFFYAKSGSNFIHLDHATTTFSNEASQVDYNYYTHCSAQYSCWDAGKGKTITNFSTWKTLCKGCDSHSSADLGKEGGIDMTTYRLQRGSWAIDHGATLGSPYNTDIAGIARPQGSAWDIGAYEYTSGPAIQSPRNLGK